MIVGYKFLDHAADVKFIAEANTIEDSFKDSAYALKETICGEIDILGIEKRNIQLEGLDLPNLLYKFLEEFIYLLDAEDFLLSTIEKIQIDKEKNILIAKVSGDKASNYKFTNDVKAITYNEMKIEEDTNKNLWKIEVVLDV